MPLPITDPRLVSPGPPPTPFLSRLASSSGSFFLPLPIPRPHTGPLADDPSYLRASQPMYAVVLFVLSGSHHYRPVSRDTLESGFVTSERTPPALASSVILSYLRPR